ncbi:acyl-CoA dehydratase activase [Deltaproteobacteria bacterium OttesenSCG-928-M10]|nr:acyl-CoA dehydratase activase [Deltaproteobacteria bacterium OttesenSCG-928-M10]
MDERPQAGSGNYFLGLDIGSISIKVALLDSSGQMVHQAYVRHYGRPFAAVREALVEMLTAWPAGEIRPPMVTGAAAGELAELLGGEAVGEIMALTLAASRSPRRPESLVDIGGEDTKVLWFQADDGGLSLADFAMNAMCAAGTGSFLDQQAHRLGYKVEEFGALALKSEVPPRVAGRCSVFAKSDMIHLQQSATPDYEIIYGLCLAMARSIKSGLAKGKSLPAPVLFTGGVAANPGLRRALREVMKLDENQLIVPDNHFVFGAFGAAVHGLETNAPLGSGLDLAALEGFLAQGHRPPERQAPLGRPSSYPSATTFDWSRVPHRIPVYIGVDVGSVSTNVVLVSEDGRLVSRQYLPTAGRPLEAIAKGFSGIPQGVRDKVEVAGVCTTGSGRYLSADYLGADMTVNEITAQATAAVAIDPKVDTIFEIGGQDSKYISLSDGVIVDFMMNKACAAGTGSFLEEQAEKLGLKIKGEFGEAALASSSPVSLGERCTVFMESDLVHHQQKGVDHKDLTAGLCYGIVANYLGRVVETRAIGRHIFFQGGTSFNQGVAAAFESRLGRPITVPDNADVTGAMGAALIARDRRTWEQSRFVGFDLSTRPYEIKSFECRDCANRCEIRKVTVAGGQPFFYGSRCGKFEEDAANKKTRPKWPDLFEYRAELAFNPPELKEILEENKEAERPRVGMIRTMFFGEMGPFWAVFWAALGFEPVWSRPTNKSIIHRGCERVGSEFCFPIKAAHGHLLDLAEMKPDYIFLPSLVNLPSGGINEAEEPRTPDSAACPYVQSLAYTAPAALGQAECAYLTGPVFFGEGEKVLADSLENIVSSLNISRPKVLEAMQKGLEAQKAFSRRLVEKGREMLARLEPQDKAMVIVARPYNGFDPGLNLRLNQKLADLGVMGLPMDFLPLNTNEGEAASHYWRYGQKITAAADLIAGDQRLEALYISNFGCGPDSFIIHFFKHQLAGKPFLEIEIDEHSSDVGAVTRLEAFLDSLAARRARGKEFAKDRGKEVPRLSLTRTPQMDKTVYIPPMCDHVIVAAAALRSVGVNAVALPPSDRETIELGRSQTSGKECYPLVLTVGDFIKLTRRPGFDPAKSSIFMPSSNGPCRFGQYGRYISLVMKRLGLEELDVISLDQTGGMYKALDSVGGRRGGQSLSRRFWRALVGIDLLQKALWRTRPREAARGAADAAYQTALADLTTAVENNRSLGPVMRMARERFEVAIDKRIPEAARPRVGLVGEIYVRHNTFANEDVIRRLEALGAEVVAPPFAEWIFYVGFVNAMRAGRNGNWRGRLKNSLIGWVQARDFKRLASAWNGFFPGGAMDPPVREVIGLGEKFLDRSFQGEAILSLGKGMEFFHHRASGLVNIMPFTCMPGMVVGGLTQNFREACSGMPSLNLSYDGQSQTNTQARLEAFMYQVKSFQARHWNGG